MKFALYPVEYWEIHSNTHSQQAKQETIRLEAVKNRANPELKTKNRPIPIVALLEQSDFIVADQEEKPTQSKPAAPFITSTLQQYKVPPWFPVKNHDAGSAPV